MENVCIFIFIESRLFIEPVHNLLLSNYSKIKTIIINNIIKDQLDKIRASRDSSIYLPLPVNFSVLFSIKNVLPT